MQPEGAPVKILFEPWNLGDAIIAAAIARTAPGRMLLACNSTWHDALTLASGNALRLLPLDLPYVWRMDKKFLALGKAVSLRQRVAAEGCRQMEVISIRGDVRDWLAARRIFRGASFRFSGWLPFCARKLSLLDLPFRAGRFPVRNRYRAWADAAGIPFSDIEHLYGIRTAPEQDAAVVIHVGAQWRSKQYPHLAGLTELLQRTGRSVELVAGPADPLPPDITEQMVERPAWADLIRKLRSAGVVIANDSGPMHLAAFLGCRTIVLSRCSNIQEWLPPGVTALSSPSAPRGYRPVPGYWSDRVLADWPEPGNILASISQ
jgi:hypothetical protein